MMRKTFKEQNFPQLREGLGTIVRKSKYSLENRSQKKGRPDFINSLSNATISMLSK